MTARSVVVRIEVAPPSISHDPGHDGIHVVIVAVFPT